ncbi:hypothetical protein [Streptomyces sp. NPDC052042]|uniref:hypothetical protein n=1 Tax=Streptomyces sp. NPDC052042 TaxID=3365683 RepID=UPI0037D3C3E0
MIIGGVMRRRWVWMLVLSIPALGPLGLAVAALVVFVVNGPTAEFWFPGRNTDGMMRAWGASIAYAFMAALGFSMAWALSKGADQTSAEGSEDPPRNRRNP